jgi:hypothetical protein
MEKNQTAFSKEKKIMDRHTMQGNPNPTAEATGTQE